MCYFFTPAWAVCENILSRPLKLGRLRNWGLSHNFITKEFTEMKKIACALFVTLGLFACKKDVKSDLPTDRAGIVASLNQHGCQVGTTTDSWIALASNVKPADAVTGVLVPLKDGAPACGLDASKPENATKCTTDGKMTDAYRAEKCVALYVAYNKLPAEAVATSATK